MGFYQELSALTSLAHPECFLAAHDATTQDAVLLLEDVAGRGHRIDQIAGYMSDLIDARVEAFGDSFVEMVPSSFAKR